jgi:O-antigen/teichoic acid export membrane protein
MRWLALSPILFAVAYLAVVALTALRRTHALLVASGSATVVNVGVNLLLIPAYSGTGAGAANTIAYGLQAAVLLVVLARAAGPSNVADLVLEPVVAAVGLAIWLIVMTVPAVAEIASGVVIYAAIWLAVVRWRRPDRLRFLMGLLRPATRLSTP